VKPIAEYQQVAKGVFAWQDYDPAVKCECSSTAILAPSGWILIDPLPLAEDAVQELIGSQPVAAVVLTNGNHQRASRRLGAPIHAAGAARTEVEADVWLKEGDLVAGALAVIDLDGFGPGEIALAGSDVLVLGDSVINIGPEGLALLPDKYCTNPRQARTSIRKLLAVDFGILCMAHGTPVAARAKERLRNLIEN
jgi:hypothetical protein